MRLILFGIVLATSQAFGFNTSDYNSSNFTSRTIGHQNGEICVLPSIPSIGSYEYSKKDLKNDNKLCALDHYSENAVCEKLWSSFPAVEYFKIKTGEVKSELEKSCSKRSGTKTNLKKLAKFKYGTSCSRTSSILGYYHIARILDIKHVPNTVIRTMDKDYHLERATEGARKAGLRDSSELIAQTWRGLKSTLKKDPRDKRRGRYLLSQDSAHSYGAISKNPAGEHFYGRPFYHGAGADTGVKRFASRSEAYKDLRNSASISSMVGEELTSSNLQRIQQMKDATELIILDTLFGQRDRIGNLHFYDVFLYSKDGEKLSSEKMKDVIKDEMENLPDYLSQLDAIKEKYPTDDKNSRSYKSNKKSKRVAQVELVSGYLKETYGVYAHAKRIIMKDNDCGFKGGNTWRDLKLVEKIKHVNQDTYTQLMALQDFIANDPSADEYLKVELTMFDEEIKTFKSNLNYIASSLNENCLAGKLKTDLNIKSHFRGENTELTCGQGLISTPAITTPDTSNESGMITAAKPRNIRTSLVLNEGNGLTDTSKLNGGTQNAAGDVFELVQIHRLTKYTFYEVKVISSNGQLSGLAGSDQTVFISSTAF